LTVGEEKQVLRKETDIAEAYDAFLKGWAYYRRHTTDDFVHAIAYFEEAVKQDPSYSRAYAALASVYWKSGRDGWSLRLGMVFSEAREKAKQHLQEAMKDPTPFVHLVASRLHASAGRYQEAITDATRAIVLDANDPAGYVAMAHALILTGSPAEAAESIKKAMRLNPHYPPGYYVTLGRAQFNMERFDESAASLEQVTKLKPDTEAVFLFLAATYGHLGREQEARSAIETYNGLRAKSEWTRPLNLQTINLGWGFKKRTDLERFREGLRKAGVPPGPDPVPAAEDLISRTEEGHYEVEGATTVDVTTAKALFDRGVPFVDVREEQYWKLARIRGAVNLDFQKVFSEVELSKIVSKNQDVLFYCSGST
jgi:tetratricopeptide (TPR) repeat protein